MKKSLPIIIVVGVVAVAAFLVWNFWGKGSVSLPAGEISKEAGEAGEEFVGKIRDVIALGTPMKCTYTQGNMSGTSYFKAKEMYGEVSAEGKLAYVIIKDNCMWSWSQEESQGVKTCFEEDFWEMSEEYEQEGQATVPTEAEYRCAPAIISDSKFNPPTSINFLDIDEMMQQLPSAE